ncbi:hypothetical protein [Amycolatopsis sp. NPDC058986]|uniref:hypothetical protein n=1 Tax=unclassified Amycolatopsis TaxID=2618356 RepID=UPI003672BA6C
MTPPRELSEHEIETLLRESLDHLAARAPDSNEVRNALARAAQERPRRRSRLALAGAIAAAVAIVAGIPLATKSMIGSGEQAATPASAVSTSDKPLLQYAPGWLPDGFAEQYRAAGPGIVPQVRRWAAGPSEIVLSAYSTDDPEWSQTALRIAALRDQVIVHGRVGMVTGDTGAAALLTWMADDHHVLTAKIAGVPEARRVAQRFADSVSGGRSVLVRGEARLGPLPAGLREQATVVQGTAPATGSTELTAAGPAGAVLRVGVGPGSPGLGGSTPVPVRGTEGRYVPQRERDDALVAVRLPSGRWLTVSGRQSRETLTAVADAVVLDPAPDYRWLGSS